MVERNSNWTIIIKIWCINYFFQKCMVECLAGLEKKSRFKKK